MSLSNLILLIQSINMEDCHLHLHLFSCLCIKTHMKRNDHLEVPSHFLNLLPAVLNIVINRREIVCHNLNILTHKHKIFIPYIMNLHLPVPDFSCWTFPAEDIYCKSLLIISPTGLCFICHPLGIMQASRVNFSVISPNTQFNCYTKCPWIMDLLQCLVL